MSIIQEALRRKQSEEIGRPTFPLAVTPPPLPAPASPPPRKRPNRAIGPLLLLLVLVALGAGAAVYFSGIDLRASWSGLLGGILPRATGKAAAAPAAPAATAPAAGEPRSAPGRLVKQARETLAAVAAERAAPEEAPVAAPAAPALAPPAGTNAAAAAAPANGPAPALVATLAPTSPPAIAAASPEAAAPASAVETAGAFISHLIGREKDKKDGAPSAEQPAVWPKLLIKGVLAASGKGKGTVLIDNAILAPGEEIKGVKIVAVQGEEVVLEFAGQQRSFRAGQPVP